jgi:hypothetical protein
MRTQYTPPALDQAWLSATLRDEFPSHKTSPEASHLIDELVLAYTYWWWLMLTYPERRIVGTPPLWIVRRIHARRLERFFADCFDYLGKVLTKESVWKGEQDFRGTFDTARSLREKFDSYPPAWTPILRLDEQLRDEKIIRLQ